MRWKQKKKHHSSRIIQFVFYFCIVFGKYWGLCYGPWSNMVRQTPGYPVHIWETETLPRPPPLWLGGSASQASDQRWRRPRVHPFLALLALSALPVPYRELQSLENVFLKVIPESTRLSSAHHAYLAFRGVHIRTCDAKDCTTGRWTIWMFIKVKIDRVKLLVIFIFLKI